MSKAKILIVDDDQDIRRLPGHRLKKEGYEAVFAGDAIAAVNVSRKEGLDPRPPRPGAPGRRRRLVMGRPRAMPALEGIPIIVVTARDVSLERESLLRAGASAVFPKPFHYDELVAAVRSGLGETAV